MVVPLDPHVPRFLRRDDGTIWALDPMPDDLPMSLEFLTEADPALVECRGDIVDIRTQNGRWVYKIVRKDIDSLIVYGRIQYREDALDA